MDGGRQIRIEEADQLDGGFLGLRGEEVEEFFDEQIQVALGDPHGTRPGGENATRGGGRLNFPCPFALLAESAAMIAPSLSRLSPEPPRHRAAK